MTRPGRLGTRLAALDRRRTLVVAGVALVALWLSAVGLTSWRAADTLVDGRDALAELPDLAPEELLDGRAAASLRSAAAALGAGADRLDRPWMAPATPIPVMGRQLRVARHLAREAAELADVAAEAADLVAAHAEPRTGRERLAALDAMAEGLERLHEAADRTDPGAEAGLIEPLEDARATFREGLVDLRAMISDGEAAITGLRRVLAGPTDLLLLAANTAEMRAGHGALLQWGVLHAEGGELTVPGGMEPIRTFPRPDPLPPLPAALEPWSWVDLGNVGNLGLTPSWDVTAGWVLDLHEASTGRRPQGVLVIDSVAIADLVELVDEPFPRADGSGLVRPGDALRYLLHDQYEGIPLDGLFRVNNERRDSLASLAEQVMEGLLEDVEPDDVADLLAESGRRRHVMAYSDDPVLQDAWRALGLAGELGPRDVGVSLVNAGPNKLDQHIETAVDVTTVRRDGEVELLVEVTATNTTPADELPYVLGFRGPDVPEDGYASLLLFSLPPLADRAQLVGSEPLVVQHHGEAGSTLAVRFDVARGETRTAGLSFRVPADERLRFLPTARVPVTRWRIDGEAVRGGPRPLTVPR